VIEFSGIDTSGTDGSGAVVQSVTNSGTPLSSLTVTLAAFGSVDNATYGTFSTNGNVTGWTPGSGFTLIHEQANATDGPSFATEFRADNDTSVDATQPGSGDMGGIAVEIKAASAAPPDGGTAAVAWYVG
jgi:hypothetical protein